MEITIFGTGYVGLVTAACMSEMGNYVTCIDIDKSRIKKLNNNQIPFYEPGLLELIKSNKERLSFINQITLQASKAKIVFITVGTPLNQSGKIELKFIYDVVDSISESFSDGTIIVIKSTVPIGTSKNIKKLLINKKNKKKYHIVNNPEFLKEGDAIRDFMHPDRIVIGSSEKHAINTLKKLYAPFLIKNDRLIIMGNEEAELVKYAANSMLATKISFINEISNICDKLNIDVENIRKGIGSDSRIGFSFIYPGIGYGGSCFDKDITALINTAQMLDLNPVLLKAASTRNTFQKQILNKKIQIKFKNLKNKCFGMWGLSFKPQTDDVRNACSIDIINYLLKNNCKLKVFDPVANNRIHTLYRNHKNFNKIVFCDNQYDAIKDVNALILSTEWKIFRNPDFNILKKNMTEHIIFDGRNQYDPLILKEKGFEYYGIGRGNTSQ